MLTNFIKLLFIVLLVYPNNLHAGCEDCYENPGDCRYSVEAASNEPDVPCDTVNKQQYFCFSGDQEWYDVSKCYKAPSGGCEEWSAELYCGGINKWFTQCGCSIPWTVNYTCVLTCLGFYSTGVVIIASEIRFEEGIEGYKAYGESSECDVVFECDHSQQYYETEESPGCGDPSVSFGPLTVGGSGETYKPEILTFRNCSGCAYCDTTAEVFGAWTDPAYEQGVKQTFEVGIDGKAKCVAEGQETGNWRCAPGYYQSGTKTVADPKKEPNIICSACPIGTYRYYGGATSLSDCTKCADGYSTFLESGGVISSHQNAKTDATDCKACPAGYYQTKSSDGYGKECKKCDIGYYNGSSGQTACTKCPNDAFITDISILNTSKTQCYINPNIKLTDSLGTIDLKDEIGGATLYYVGP